MEITQGQQNMTEGNVVKQILKFSLPLVASSLLQALYNMCDMIIAGHFIGPDALSAINNSSQVLVTITKIAIGLMTGGNVLIGQFFGGKHYENQKKATGTLLSAAFMLGTLTMLLLYFFAEPILIALRAPSLSVAAEYLKICAIGIFFVFIYNAMSATFQAVGNSKTPTRIVMFSTVANIILDLLFVAVFDMGIKGTAIATTIAQASSAILCLFALLKRREMVEISFDFFKIRKEMLGKIFKFGIPSAIQMSIAGFSWLTITFLINKYGIDASAGNGVAIKIKDLCQMLLSAMSTGAISIIAQNLGAKLYDRAKSVMYTTMKITLIMSVISIVSVELLSPYMARIFSDDQNVINAAVLNMRIEIVGQIFYAIFMVYHSLAIGAGHSAFAMISSFVNCILARVILAFLFDHLFGLWGIYLACAIAPFSSVPVCLWYVKSNKWRRSINE